MTCPICGEKTNVLASRSMQAGSEKWRRRECLICGHRFNTTETDADSGKSPRRPISPETAELIEKAKSLCWELERILGDVKA